MNPKYTLVIGLFLIIFGCNESVKPFPTATSESKNATYVGTTDFFCDSINFGIKYKTRIEIHKIIIDDSVLAKVDLFLKDHDQWKSKDSLSIVANLTTELNPVVDDFNNDGFKDILFTSGSAARGGNVVQTLILFNPKTFSLIWIKNSENFPNIMYNPKLNCLDAFILTGGQTTYFLKIKNDSLKEFARVDQRDGMIISEVLNTKDEWIEIERVKGTIEGFDRFIDFNPIQIRHQTTPPNIHSHTEFIDIEGEYLSAKMRPVRNNVKRIDSIKNWTEITKKAIIDSTHQLDATFYYQNRILEKVVLIQKDEVSEVETKFFLLDNDISFVVKKTTSRVNSEAEVILDESYFENGKLFNQLNNQDCGSPFSKEYLRKEQERINTKFSILNSRNNTP